jgi:transposase
VRSQDSLDEISTEWEHAPLDILIAAAPWRTFRWHRGPKHYSGTYRSSTEQRHVIYESRFEGRHPS